MNEPDRTVCDVVGCDGTATGSYLHSTGRSAIEFAVCDFHFDQLKDGSKTVILDGRKGQRWSLLVE